MAASSGQQAMVNLVATRGLYHRHNLEAVLGIVDGDPRFAPSTWGLEERESHPYDREQVIARGAPTGRALPQTSLHLRRKSSPPYEATFSLWQRAILNLELSPKASATDHPRLFELADKLAGVTAPDFGTVHVWVGLRDDFDEPWEDDNQRDAELMMYAGNLVPVDYYGEGPAGLAMRTYLGPHFIEQLGADRIESLPLVVEKQAWGGYRIDLVPEPWAADVPTLLDAWRRGMEHLAAAEVFAVADFEDDQISLSKNAAVKIGGVIRD